MADFNKKTVKDLQKLLAEARSEMRGIRFDVSGSRVKDVKGGHNKKREIAQILTELRKRELAVVDDAK